MAPSHTPPVLSHATVATPPHFTPISLHSSQKPLSPSTCSKLKQQINQNAQNVDLLSTSSSFSSASNNNSTSNDNIKLEYGKHGNWEEMRSKWLLGELSYDDFDKKVSEGNVSKKLYNASGEDQVPFQKIVQGLISQKEFELPVRVSLANMIDICIDIWDAENSC